jgi:hypothetical protein
MFFDVYITSGNVQHHEECTLYLGNQEGTTPHFLSQPFGSPHTNKNQRLGQIFADKTVQKTGRSLLLCLFVPNANKKQPYERSQLLGSALPQRGTSTFAYVKTFASCHVHSLGALQHKTA